jgi:hypothetical protein
VSGMRDQSLGALDNFLWINAWGLVSQP